MENVKGILSSKIEGAPIVDRIISDLKSPLATGLNVGGSPKPLHYQLHPFSDITTNHSRSAIKYEIHPTT